MLKLVPLLLVLISCSQVAPKHGRVILIKQWPLNPRVNTLNVKVSVKNAEYANQRVIYDQLQSMIETSQGITLISERCEKGMEIDQDFIGTYNGWNYSSLSVMREQPHYAEIITHLPLKLKAKAPKKVTVICGDDEALLKSSELALSEARGYTGFFYRMDSAKDDPVKFAVYKESLEDVEKKKISDPLKYTESKALENVANFWRGVQKRNKKLIETVQDNIDKNPILIVSGLRVKDLNKQLMESGIKVEVLTPEGYPQASENLGEELTKALRK